MDDALILAPLAADPNAHLAEMVRHERQRLWNFIRKRVLDEGEAEDILQEVFAELVEASRLSKPIEKVSSWLFRVARNRITDWFRKRRPERFSDIAVDPGAPDSPASFEDLLPSPDAGPEAAFARTVLLEELEAALAELPEEQRHAFVGQEIEGRTFREMADESGIPVPTLISRKRYAIQHLRRRLQSIHHEFTRPLGEKSI